MTDPVRGRIFTTTGRLQHGVPRYVDRVDGQLPANLQRDPIMRSNTRLSRGPLSHHLSTGPLPLRRPRLEVGTPVIYTDHLEA